MSKCFNYLYQTYNENIFRSIIIEKKLVITIYLTSWGHYFALLKRGKHNVLFITFNCSLQCDPVLLVEQVFEKLIPKNPFLAAVMIHFNYGSIWSLLVVLILVVKLHCDSQIYLFLGALKQYRVTFQASRLKRPLNIIVN